MGEPLTADELFAAHQPDCAETSNGGRGHFCVGCSETVSEYVNWPCPAIRAEVERLREQVARAETERDAFKGAAADIAQHRMAEVAALRQALAIATAMGPA